jgi:hypothetical protein
MTFDLTLNWRPYPHWRYSLPLKFRCQAPSLAAAVTQARKEYPSALITTIVQVRCTAN